MKKTADIPSHPPKRASHYILHFVLYFCIALLLLTPTYIAIGSYIQKKNNPVVETTTVYTAMTLTGPKNGRIEADGSRYASLLRIFVSLIDSGENAFGVPASHLTGAYAVAMRNDTLTEQYRFYFSPDSEECYYTKQDGSIFFAKGDSVRTFLGSSFAYELYAGAQTPVLTTAATDVVTPYAVTWHYRAQNTFTQLSATTADSTLVTYPIANDIAFYFSIQPSHHEVIIRRAGSELYRGPADAISLTLEGQDDVLDFEINAIYNQDSQLDYYGSIVYRFRMQVVEAARFSLNTLSTQAGGFFLLNCENVKNAQNLRITAEPALPCAPVILQRGDRVYAAIPAGAAGRRELQVTYGTIAASFTLDVTATESTTHAPATEALGGDWVTLLSDTLPTLIAQKGASADTPELTPQGVLRLPGGTRLFAYGDAVTVEGTLLEQHALPFSLYKTASAVQVLSAGRVIEVGEHLHLGRYVIVDHGCGLYTWYAGLSETRVRAGDILAVGDVVGLPGRVLYRESCALVMATLGKAAVSLDFLSQKPLIP